MYFLIVTTKIYLCKKEPDRNIWTENRDKSRLQEEEEVEERRESSLYIVSENFNGTGYVLCFSVDTQCIRLIIF